MLLVISVSAQAAVTCKGNAYGIASTYTFTKIPNSRDLQLSIKTIIATKEQYSINGIATHTSTSALTMLGEKSILESYYIFVHGSDSFTELLSLSPDLKMMGSARPDPRSELGNFFKLSCTGTL